MKDELSTITPHTATANTLQSLRIEHAWLLTPVENAVRAVVKTPFFETLQNLRQPLDFKPIGIQIFHHSATLPKAIGMMLAATKVREGLLYQVYAEHAHEEADHHLLLLAWMLEHGVVATPEEVYDGQPTLETTSCINIAYEFAAAGDHNGWMATMNSAIELCFWTFFKNTAAKMHEIGTPHRYFDVHVTADEHHSVMGLKYLRDLDKQERLRLIRRGLDGITLWTAMVHSWIGMSISPRFSLDGNPLEAT